MKIVVLFALMLSAVFNLSAQEVVGWLPRGWQPQTEYPLAWSGDGDFEEWRTTAREKMLELMGIAPQAPETTTYRILSSEPRDGYTAHKIEFEVSKGNFVVAYLLIPDGEGPFPALLALHDHGAKFSIGKEKMVRPICESPEVVADAEVWSAKNYDGVFTGDWFASQGYVVLATDALLWGNRGEGEDGRQTAYNSQQAVASNCIKLGTTLVGIITHDDIRSVDFLAAQEFVDPERIGVYGHSMGGHRAWMVAALSDRVAALASVCWMATSDALLEAGNNELKGGSAFTMQIPLISRYLDNPDIASMVCPRPALFISGSQDKLFPKGVEEAHAKMQRVWHSQGAKERLHCHIYPSPHYFGVEMQGMVKEFFDNLFYTK